MKRWSTKGVNWKEYTEEIKANVEVVDMGGFLGMSVDEKVEYIVNVFIKTNDSMMNTVEGRKSKRSKWWSAELLAKKRVVGKGRKKMQLARRTCVNIVNLVNEYRILVKVYKCMIKKAKLNDWKRFVGMNADDPWGKVYKICR